MAWAPHSRSSAGIWSATWNWNPTVLGKLDLGFEHGFHFGGNDNMVKPFGIPCL